MEYHYLAGDYVTYIVFRLSSCAGIQEVRVWSFDFFGRRLLRLQGLGSLRCRAPTLNPKPNKDWGSGDHGDKTRQWDSGLLGLCEDSGNLHPYKKDPITSHVLVRGCSCCGVGGFRV